MRQRKLIEEAKRAFLDITEVMWREKTFNPFGYKKMPGYYNLPDYQRQRLRNLYSWRYHKAQEIDRAPFLILDDRLLMTLAQAEIDLTDQTTNPPEDALRRFLPVCKRTAPDSSGTAPTLSGLTGSLIPSPP